MEYRTEISKTYSAAGSLGLFLLRLIPFVMLFIFHGWSKLAAAYGYLFEGQDWMFIGAAEKLGFPYAPYFAVGAALAESLFAVLLILGLLTRFSAAVVSFSFMVAVYSHVIKDWRIELAALYLAAALAILFLGPGGISLDALMRGRPAVKPKKDASKIEVYDPATTAKDHRIEVSEDTERLDLNPERPTS